MDVEGLNKLEGQVIRFAKTVTKSRLVIQDFTLEADTSLINRVIKNFKDGLKLEMKYMDHDLNILEEIRQMTRFGVVIKIEQNDDLMMQWMREGKTDAG